MARFYRVQIGKVIENRLWLKVRSWWITKSKEEEQAELQRLSFNGSSSLITMEMSHTNKTVYGISRRTNRYGLASSSQSKQKNDNYLRFISEYIREVCSEQKSYWGCRVVLLIIKCIPLKKNCKKKLSVF